MKTIAAILLTAFLAGCATTSPQFGVFTPHAKKGPVVKAAPVVTPKFVAPPATFKQRWYQKFKHHPKLFH